jgi:hypothetical protein
MTTVLQGVAVGAQVEYFTIPLGDGATAVVGLPRPLTSEGVDLIVEWLALVRSSLTSAA